MKYENSDRVRLFIVESNCPIVNKPAALYQDTWDNHISRRHPEVNSRLMEIESTVTAPSYAANSLPGPGGRNNGNLVLVNDKIILGASYLHVFLTDSTSEWRVTSAIFSKNYHSDKVWEVGTSGVESDYDAEADVLYLSKGKPQAAFTEPSTEGLLFRYAIQDSTPCGITVLSYKADWQDHHDLLAQQITQFLGVERAAAERALEDRA
jgi:hypothetical protein